MINDFGAFRENGVCRGKMELALTTEGGGELAEERLGIVKSFRGN